MTSAAAVLDLARGQLGTRESPAGSNRTRYGAAYGWQGQPWCAMFVWWVFVNAGASALLPKTAYTPTLADWFRDAGRWGRDPRPGALVFYDFPGKPDRISHVGLVEAVNADGSIVTIEGNTSAGSSGSQSNGDGVWRRTRRAYVVGYGYPAYSAAPPPGPAITRPAALTRLRRGSIGPEVGELQAVLAAWYPHLQLQVDQEFGPATAAAVRHLQRRVGLPQTGIADVAEFRALGMVR